MARLRAAAKSILQVEFEVQGIPDPNIRRWFMSKPGHREAFVLARFALNVLAFDNEHDGLSNAITEAANEVGR